MFKKVRKKLAGFTLIEAVIVVTTITVLAVAVISLLNPKEMLNRAQDGQRMADMNKIKIRLEEYMNDNQCYPTSLPFGQILPGFDSNEKIPQDPLYPGATYVYISGNNCPKWYGMFYNKQSKSMKYVPEVLAAGSGNKANCELPVDCVPANFHSGWGCLIAGNVDCAVIRSSTLPETYFPSPTPIPPTVTPMPTNIGVTYPVPTTTLSPGITLGVGTTLITRILDFTGPSWCKQTDYKVSTKYGTFDASECIDSTGTFKTRCQGPSLVAKEACGRAYDTVKKQYIYSCGPHFSFNCSAGRMCISEAGFGQCMAMPPTNLAVGITITGKDGTWCSNADTGGPVKPGNVCVDNSGSHPNVCLGTIANNKFCTYNFNNGGYYNVRCFNTGDLKCGYDMSCVNSICVNGNPTATPTMPKPTAVVPTPAVALNLNIGTTIIKTFAGVDGSWVEVTYFRTSTSEKCSNTTIDCTATACRDINGWHYSRSTGATEQEQWQEYFTIPQLGSHEYSNASCHNTYNTCSSGFKSVVEHLGACEPKL